MARIGRPRAFDPEAALARARDLFWSRGYAATSVQDLVDGLSVQRGSLYAAFGDKRALYLKAVRLYDTDNRRRLAELLQEGLVLPVLRRMLTQPSTLIGPQRPGQERRGCLVGNTTAELVPADDEAGAVVAAAYDGFVDVVSTALRRAQATGEVTSATTPETQAQLVLLLFQGSALVSRARTDQARLDSAVDAVLETLRPAGTC